METLKLGDFMGRVYQKNKGKRSPVRTMMELTYTCNHKCIHCYNSKAAGRKELSKEEVFSVVDQLVDIGTLRITFTGGEIFTRPDIMKIILYARKRGLQVVLMTNGSLITEDIADRLISWGVSRFEISFLGAGKKTFDEMTRVKGSFKKVVASVEMLREKEVVPRIKTCVTSVNFEELEAIAELARELGALFSYSPQVIPRSGPGQRPGYLMIGPEEFICINERIRSGPSKKRGYPPTQKPHAPAAGESRLHSDSKMKKAREIPGFWEKKHLFSCMASHTATFINPYGEMKACITLPEPSFDTRKMSVRECWEGVKEFADNLKPPSDWNCYSCEYQNWCSWCPGRGYLNTGDIFGCPPYYRELARIRKERYENSR